MRTAVQKIATLTALDSAFLLSRLKGEIRVLLDLRYSKGYLLEAGFGDGLALGSHTMHAVITDSFGRKKKMAAVTFICDQWNC